MKSRASKISKLDDESVVISDYHNQSFSAVKPTKLDFLASRMNYLTGSTNNGGAAQ